MSSETGPAALRRLADDIRKNDNLRFTAQLIDNFAHDWDAERAQAAADRAALERARALAEQEMARAERAEEQAFHVTMETYRTGLVGDAFRFMQYWQERSLKQSAAARKVAQAYRKVAADGEHDFWTEHNRAETMKAERDACEEENDDLRDEIRIYEAQESELERALAAALSGGAR